MIHLLAAHGDMSTLIAVLVTVIVMALLLYLVDRYSTKPSMLHDVLVIAIVVVTIIVLLWLIGVI